MKELTAEILDTLCEKRADGCWQWKGNLYSRGYGSYNREQAHRASYRLSKGEIPKGHDIHHLCRNRACVNPEHLSCLHRHVHQRIHHDKFLSHPRAPRKLTAKDVRLPKAQHLVIATTSLPTY